MSPNKGPDGLSITPCDALPHFAWIAAVVAHLILIAVSVANYAIRFIPSRDDQSIFYGLDTPNLHRTAHRAQAGLLIDSPADNPCSFERRLTKPGPIRDRSSIV
ncbi:hypothetical protein [Rhodococcus jostii]